MSSLFDARTARIPGGVNSPVRSFASVGGEPFFVARGEGAYLFDTDGRRYIDYVQSWGASILGHAHPGGGRRGAARRGRGNVVRRTHRARGRARRGHRRARAVGRQGPPRVVGHRSRDDRGPPRAGATGRAKILKFAGCYHGHVDALLVAAGSGVATLGLPGSAGVTEGTVADTVVVPYNDEAALDEAFDRYGDELAAVLVEPVAANMGLVAPADGFLDGLRRRCTDAGALLVFDEVITGFRLGPAGAQGVFGITPDLSMFGKVVGGGLPLAAVGGRAEIMDHLAPARPRLPGRHALGNPLATAAGLAVLHQLDAAAYVALERARPPASPTVCAPRFPTRTDRGDTVGTLTGIFFAKAPVTNYERGATRRPRAVRDVLPPDARRRHLPRPERLRDPLRLPGPHRPA